MPLRRTRLPKAMQIDMLAHRLIPTRNLDNLLFLKPAYRDFSFALSAV
jgi:hypothetical protein